MKPGPTLVFALTLLQVLNAPPASPNSANFPFVREIGIPNPGEYCAVLDALVFSHAASSLKDLRLLSSIGEIPYLITLSETAELTGESAPLVQLNAQANGISFDLDMPQRPYTDVVLEVAQQNFEATATVFGMNDLSAPARTPLGTFTLFDLTARHLSRNTTLALQESAFRYLHVELDGSHLLPANIHGAYVPPSRQAQTIYTPVATSSLIRQRGSDTIATFQIPAHVPVERVSVELDPGYTGNFSRTIRVSGKTGSPGESVETIEGTISQVHLGRVQSRQLAFAFGMGVNLQQDATVEAAIENGIDGPLPIASIRLEMRQRSLCFTAPAAAVDLFYGDAKLSAPAYARGTPFISRQVPGLATLGPETRNPAFRQAGDTRTFFGRRPDVLWFLLLAGLGVMGIAMLHTLRRR